MNTILEKILKGEITSDDLTDPLQIVQNEVSFIIWTVWPKCRYRGKATMFLSACASVSSSLPQGYLVRSVFVLIKADGM